MFYRVLNTLSTLAKCLKIFTVRFNEYTAKPLTIVAKLSVLHCLWRSRLRLWNGKSCFSNKERVFIRQSNIFLYLLQQAFVRILLIISKRHETGKTSKFQRIRIWLIRLSNGHNDVVRCIFWSLCTVVKNFRYCHVLDFVMR